MTFSRRPQYNRFPLVSGGEQSFGKTINSFVFGRTKNTAICLACNKNKGTLSAALNSYSVLNGKSEKNRWEGIFRPRLNPFSIEWGLNFRESCSCVTS